MADQKARADLQGIPFEDALAIVVKESDARREAADAKRVAEADAAAIEAEKKN